jgi:hypothetical protein
VDLYIHFPHTPSWRSAEEVKQRDSFTLPYENILMLAVLYGLGTLFFNLWKDLSLA